jgi:hypothetical protein
LIEEAAKEFEVHDDRDFRTEEQKRFSEELSLKPSMQINENNDLDSENCNDDSGNETISEEAEEDNERGFISD